ncbi:putative nicotinate-nucleotide adenylyltransferase, partial [Dissostichus eleginoides]
GNIEGVTVVGAAVENKGRVDLYVMTNPSEAVSSLNCESSVAQRPDNCLRNVGLWELEDVFDPGNGLDEVTTEGSS